MGFATEFTQPKCKGSPIENTSAAKNYRDFQGASDNSSASVARLVHFSRSASVRHEQPMLRAATVRAAH